MKNKFLVVLFCTVIGAFNGLIASDEQNEAPKQLDIVAERFFLKYKNRSVEDMMACDLEYEEYFIKKCRDHSPNSFIKDLFVKNSNSTEPTTPVTVDENSSASTSPIPLCFDKNAELRPSLFCGMYKNS